MINALSSALSGLSFATKQINESAARVAKAGTPEGENVDLAEEAVNIKLSEIAYKANLTTIKAADEISEELFRIIDKEV